VVIKGTAMPTAAAPSIWLFTALRGVLAILLALITLLWPAWALASLVLLFAIYMLVDGVAALVGAVRAGRAHGRWLPLLIEGLLNIIAGLIALFLPGATLVAFVLLIAIWGIVTGIMLIAAAIRHDAGGGRWPLGLAGLVSAVWGIAVLLAPGLGALTLVLWIGAYAFAFGVLLLVSAVRLRARERAARAPATA